MNQTELPELDYAKLDRELDRTKTRVFLGKSAAFLGPLMCSMEFGWKRDIPTACTNGEYVWWNPDFFLACTPAGRDFVLVHELWHPAYLHMIRCGTRDPKIWNYAADIVINNALAHDGYSMAPSDLNGIEVWRDHAYDGWTTEDVYDDLIAKGVQPPPTFIIDLINGTGDGSGQMVPGNQHTILNNVMTAVHSATLNGGTGAGMMPGEVEVTLKKFLAPKLPWEQMLRNFFNELAHQDYSWARPNRRHHDIYLPGMVDDRNGLDHIAYFLDVSGSISDNDIIRFHSEFKHVKEYYTPEKMTMLQFDVIIQKTEVFEKDDPFEETHVIGRGGTSLVPVRQWIIDNKPTAVVIFSDLFCDVMAPLPEDAKVPIIWVALNNRKAVVNEGTIFHLND